MNLAIPTEVPSLVYNFGPTAKFPTDKFIPGQIDPATPPPPPPQPVWEGRQGAETALVSGRTTVSLSHSRTIFPSCLG